MIGEVLTLLKNRLNSHLQTLAMPSQDGISEDKVAFPETDAKSDAVSFRTGAVTVLLYRVEQEAALRQADPFSRTHANGSTQRVQPDLALNLHVLFVARFKDYALGLHYLSQVIGFFQTNSTLDRRHAPGLPEAIGELAIDLVTLSVQQQNEIWGLLRTGYLPSVAYRVRTLTFRDERALPAGPPIIDLELRQQHLP